MASFPELQQIAEILNGNKLKYLPDLHPAQDPGTLTEALYLGIAGKQFADDAEAADALYQKAPNAPAYQMLKSRLYDRMINSILIIDTDNSHYTSFQKAFYFCERNIAVIRFLLGRYARQAAIKLAEKTLKKAIKFEFTQIVLELARILRFHYGTISGDRKEYLKYEDLINKYSAILMAELRAEELYTDLIIEFVNKRGTSIEVAEKADYYYQELRELIENFHSYRLNYVSFSLFVIRFEISHDYENTLKVCDEAINYFEKKKHLASTSLVFSFQYKILASCIHLGYFDKAEESAEKCITITPEGFRNWFIVLDYYMILCFHSQKFQKAFGIYQKAITHPRFNYQQGNIMEHWRIYEAFVHYFILIGKIDPGADHSLKKFRLSKFLNEVPTYSKDKRGANISILILQVLFLLQRGAYEKIIDRMEALKTYTHRYLRQDETFRSNCFIKMLLALPASAFHKKAVLRRAAKYRDRLQSAPLNVANQSAEIEIVPYEMLWEFVLESLDEKFH